jgi:hypothetical protein
MLFLIPLSTIHHRFRRNEERPMHSLPLHTKSSGSPCGAIFVHIIRTTLSNMTMPVSYWNSHNRLSSPKIPMEVMPWFDWTCDMFLVSNHNKFIKCCFWYLCQQYITDLEEMRNESQYRVCPPMELISATHLLYIEWMNASHL